MYNFGNQQANLSCYTNTFVANGNNIDYTQVSLLLVNSYYFIYFPKNSNVPRDYSNKLFFHYPGIRAFMNEFN